VQGCKKTVAKPTRGRRKEPARRDHPWRGKKLRRPRASSSAQRWPACRAAKRAGAAVPAHPAALKQREAMRKRPERAEARDRPEEAIPRAALSRDGSVSGKKGRQQQAAREQGAPLRAEQSNHDNIQTHTAEGRQNFTRPPRPLPHLRNAGAYDGRGRGAFEPQSSNAQLEERFSRRSPDPAQDSARRSRGKT